MVPVRSPGANVSARTTAAYAAALWAFAFAALSFYWALGSSWLAATQSESILELAEHRWFLAVVGLTVLLKVAAGLVALSLVQRWGTMFPFALRLFGVWSIGTILLLYGSANLAVRALMALGLLETPASMRTVRATWHLILWDPFFVLGSVLFLLCGLVFTRSKAGRRIDTAVIR